MTASCSPDRPSADIRGRGSGTAIATSRDADVLGRADTGDPAHRSALPPARRLLASQELPDHLGPLFRAAFGLCGSREDAEDLVQETYARVLRRPRWLRPG